MTETKWGPGEAAKTARPFVGDLHAPTGEPEYGREGYEPGEDDQGAASYQQRALQRALIGRMLAEPELVGPMLEAGILPEHLEGAPERRCLRAIRGLWAEGEPIDADSVLQWLRKRGTAPAGFDVWLAKVVSHPFTADPLPFARMLQEDYLWGVLGRAFDLGARETKERRFTPLELKQQVEDLLAAMVRPEQVGRRVGEVVADLQDLWNGSRPAVQFVPTGLEDLDDFVRGLAPGHLWCVAARSSMGKSAFATALIDGVCVTQRVPTALWTLEDGEEEYTQRIVARRSGVPLRMLDGEVSAEWTPDLHRAAADLDDAPLEIFDVPSVTPTEIRAQVQRLRAHGVRLIIVDQLDKVEHPPADRNDLRILATTKALKQIAREFGITVVLLHQIRRDVDKRKNPRPTLADLYDAPVEKDCDVVCLLFRPEYHSRNVRPRFRKLLEVIVAKQRKGPTGTVDLSFDNECARVRTRTYEEDHPTDDGDHEPTGNERRAEQTGFFDDEDDQ